MSQDRPTAVALYQQVEQECLSLQSAFRFHCHEGLPCFNQCCLTPTIILSPFDILRLKQCLGITSGEFLARYTLRETEARSNLPLIFLDAFRSPEGGCPFLGPGGCTVYAHRPAACRLFPITMGSRLTEQGVVDFYFCRRLDYCRGFDTDVQWTVDSWKAGQGLEEYEGGRREWLEILLIKGLMGSLPSDARLQELFAMVAYDLDRFRRLLSEPAFLEVHELGGEAPEYLKESDLALLHFGYRFLRSLLFPGEGDSG
jgi:hypothetical protein